MTDRTVNFRSDNERDISAFIGTLINYMTSSLVLPTPILIQSIQLHSAATVSHAFIRLRSHLLDHCK